MPRSRKRAAPAPAGVAIDGAQVRELRQLSGQTLMSLAASCDISTQYLSMIERGGRTRVSPPVFGRICDALGIKDRRDLVRQVAA